MGIRVHVTYHDTLLVAVVLGNCRLVHAIAVLVVGLGLGVGAVPPGAAGGGVRVALPRPRPQLPRVGSRFWRGGDLEGGPPSSLLCRPEIVKSLEVNNPN